MGYAIFAFLELDRHLYYNILKYCTKYLSFSFFFLFNTVFFIAIQEWYTEVKELFSGILDFSMFLELHFLFLSLSTILLFTWFIVPYFYLTDFIMDQGLSDTDASTIISTIGATNTIGMVRISELQNITHAVVLIEHGRKE